MILWFERPSGTITDAGGSRFFIPSLAVPAILQIYFVFKRGTKVDFLAIRRMSSSSIWNKKSISIYRQKPSISPSLPVVPPYLFQGKEEKKSKKFRQHQFGNQQERNPCQSCLFHNSSISVHLGPFKDLMRKYPLSLKGREGVFSRFIFMGLGARRACVFVWKNLEHVQFDEGFLPHQWLN